MKISIYIVGAAIAAAFLVVAISPGVYALVSAGPSDSDISLSRVEGLNAFNNANLFGYGWGFYGVKDPYSYPAGQYGFYNVPGPTGSTKQACVWNGYNWRCNDFGR
jgi:hypothetical protein